VDLNEGGSIKREVLLVMALSLMVAACGTVAVLLGRSLWAALLGGALVVVYWLIERYAAKLGARGGFGTAVAVGLGGMMVRVFLVLGALTTVGILAKPAFPEAALSFVVVYSAYQVLRLLAHPVSAARVSGGEEVRRG
jgi:hypothetical protein